MDKINDDTSLDLCKFPTTLEEVEKEAGESIMESDNYVSEDKNYFAEEI